MKETWVRARTPDQKERRIRQILSAAVRLLKSQSIDDITMGMIAEEAAFTRSNLYRYFTTREEVFLSILKEDLVAWVRALPEDLGSAALPAEGFSKIWIDSFLANSRMNDLLSVLSTKLEAGSSVEALMEFKIRISGLYREEAEAICKVIPGLSRPSAYRVLMLRSALVVGAYPAINPTGKQRDALSQAGIPIAAEQYRQMMIDSISAFIGALVADDPKTE
jgi:TetR/AcrR family transcriptional regulator